MTKPAGGGGSSSVFPCYAARAKASTAPALDDHVVHLLRLDLHDAPAEALQVGKRRMGADRDAALERERYGLADGGRIAAVKAAGDVRGADERHDAGVGAHLPGAVAFPHVAVQIDPLQLPKSQGIRPDSISPATEDAERCLTRLASHDRRA